MVPNGRHIVDVMWAEDVCELRTSVRRSWTASEGRWRRARRPCRRGFSEMVRRECWTPGGKTPRLLGRRELCEVNVLPVSFIIHLLVGSGIVQRQWFHTSITSRFTCGNVLCFLTFYFSSSIIPCSQGLVCKLPYLFKVIRLLFVGDGDKMLCWYNARYRLNVLGSRYF